ncbi:MAG TPA: hypothetical protein VGS19_37085 [Streptosporangiaceae bacterium]|nr:hypothetical protein [Streptosporangiaceae bacterium]
MAGLLAVLGTSAASASGTPPPVSTARWEQAIKQLKVPAHGCFHASYPAIQWLKTRCVAAPHRPYPPAPGLGLRPTARRGGPQIVGNGVDYAAEVSGSLSSVTGSFGAATAVNTETGQQNGIGGQVANTFSLQLNAKPFSTPVCAGSGTPGICLGWQQFVYSTTYNVVFMQYWLLNWNAACPAGWFAYSVDCYTNSGASTLFGGPLAVTDLPSTSLTGTVAGGGNDSVALTSGVGSATAVNSDGVLDIAGNWTGVEWGVFGDCCGTEANFGAGTTLAVTTNTHNGTTTAPTCVYEGFTGETNNLFLAPTPGLLVAPSPELISDQTSSPSGVPSCATAHGIGDTHLDTFSNLFYDFQAAGDFQLANAPNFRVQNRQVSGAPVWPNADVNQAVAAQFGSSKVAVCAASQPGGAVGQLYVNGANVNLPNGGQLNLPNGSVSLNGNTYTVQDLSGNSLAATVNTNGALNWIDAHVGLGRWPEPVTGLLASATTNPDAVTTRGGTVLTAPFGFSRFYGTYAKSWRDATTQDLLNVCGTPPAPTTATNVFYANNLPPALAQQAQAICLSRGVRATALLNACTVDEAVTGEIAPGVYKTLPAQVIWGKIKPPIARLGGASVTRR